MDTSRDGDKYQCRLDQQPFNDLFGHRLSNFYAVMSQEIDISGYPARESQMIRFIGEMARRWLAQGGAASPD